jgi:LmbE family N-acetylglucosaminyl deacetylase
VNGQSPGPDETARSLADLVTATATLTVISPHLDDAVLSCGDLLAQRPGAVVVTAFAGIPDRYPELTSWDARAGFEDGADVVGARREEDRAALAVLGARPSWLPFPDPQYGPKPERRELAEALGAAVDELSPELVLLPLGLFHDDHILTGDAVLDALRTRPGLRAIAYADAIYRRVPDLVDRRLAALRAAGLDLQALAALDAPASPEKHRAVACYRSQVRALERSWDGGVSDAFEPEQYWLVTAPAATAGSTRRSGGRSGHISDA